MRVVLGRVARAVGLRGEILVLPIVPEGETLLRARELEVGGARREVERSERRRQGVLVALRGVATRGAAEALCGKEVAVEREALPPLGEGEHYAVDLVGLALVDRKVGKIGEIAAVAAMPGQDLLVVRKEGREILVPFAGAYGPEVDRGAGEVRMSLPEGILELGAGWADGPKPADRGGARRRGGAGNDRSFTAHTGTRRSWP